MRNWTTARKGNEVVGLCNTRSSGGKTVAFRKNGGAAPSVLNAANEVAVAAFAAGKLDFTGIAALVTATLEAAQARGISKEALNVVEALAVDHIARSLADDLLPEIAAKAF